MVKLGIIGCGYWGINLVRNYYNTEDCIISAVADTSEERRNNVKENFEDVRVLSDYKLMLLDNMVDAIAIATPPGSHYSLAKEALNAGKHVFVEKPLAMNSEHACELVKLAEEKEKILMVGHTVLYNDAIKDLKEIINSGDIGDIYYIYSSRLNLGIVRPDVNVMWSLAPHDISILLYLLDKKALRVSAKGLSYIQNQIEDVVYLNITFENNINAQIHLSWLDPHKKRDITIVGSKKMLVYDDLSEERIKIFDKGIERQNKSGRMAEYDSFVEYSLIHRAGEVIIPKVNINEPLRQECRHFIDCIIENKEPLTSGKSSIEVVRILETAEKSLHDDGSDFAVNNR
jgi:predicted dehydrogenase